MTALDFDVVPDVNNNIAILSLSISLFTKSRLPDFKIFSPSSFNVQKLSYPSCFVIHIYLVKFVLLFFSIAFIFSIYFSSNTTTSALLLSKQLSNSSTCNSLSSGIDIIPPSRFARCATTHSYLFLPTIAILFPFNPSSYSFVPKLFTSSSSFLYVMFSYSAFSLSFLCFITNAMLSENFFTELYNISFIFLQSTDSKYFSIFYVSFLKTY